jgi:hypothetical protein
MGYCQIDELRDSNAAHDFDQFCADE